MTKASENTSKPSLTKVYDRRLKISVDGIGTTEDKFILENGYYVNERETVILKSTNETGKFFKKII